MERSLLCDLSKTDILTKLLFLMQSKICHWIQWFETTLTTALGFDTSCPNSPFTVDTLHTSHEIIQLLYSSRTSTFTHT